MWITVDPGETVGWALWEGDEMIEAGQDPTWAFIDRVDLTLTEGNVAWGDTTVTQLQAIVCEDFAIYPWKMNDLAWDKVRTARAIGALELLARQHHIPFELQAAKIKEAAVAAGAEELFLSPRHENRHANDAIMHGVFYLAMHKNQAPGQR